MKWLPKWITSYFDRLAKAEARILELEKLYVEERNAKRHLANHLMDVVYTGRAISSLQPASYAKNQEEAERWAKFYDALNKAPVGFPFSKIAN